jgi:hypothetical protein
MKGCEECGKRLGILNGYRHPIRGRNHLVCSECFDSIHESVVNWRKANTPYIGFFNKINSTKSNNHNIFDIADKIINPTKFIENFPAEKGI